MSALRQDCGTNNSMAAAAEAVQIAEEAYMRRSSGGANNSVAAAADAVRWAELDSFRRGSGGQNSSMAADIEAYRRRNSGGGNNSAVAEADARFADVDVLRRNSGLGDMDTFRRRSSGGHSTSLSMVAEAVRRVEMESLRQVGGGAGSSMASAAETIRLLEMERMQTRRRKSSGAASLAAAAEAVRYAETLSGANDAGRFGDFEDECEDVSRFPLRSNLMSVGRSCDTDQNSSSFSPATHSTSRRCMPQRQHTSTLRRGPYTHEHNKRHRVSFTTGGDFPVVTSDNSK